MIATLLVPSMSSGADDITTEPGTTEYVLELSLKPRRWEQVSFPGTGDTSFGALVGDALPRDAYGTDWVIYRWEPDGRRYRLAELDDAPAQGEGVWMQHTLPADVGIVPTPQATDPETRAGAACGNESGCVHVPLAASDGDITWSMTGNPALATVSRHHILLHTVGTAPCVDGCQVSDRGGPANRLVVLYRYDSDTEAYRDLRANESGDAIGAWQAWWTGTTGVGGSVELVFDPSRAKPPSGGGSGGVGSGTPVTRPSAVIPAPEMVRDGDDVLAVTTDGGLDVLLLSTNPEEGLGVLAASEGTPFVSTGLEGRQALRFDDGGGGDARAAVISSNEERLVIECTDDSDECDVLPVTIGSDGQEYFDIREDAYYGVVSND